MSTEAAAPGEVILAVRATKRKLDDAFQSLDDAVSQHDYHPPPLKKTNTARSLYSTLAKYGIKSKEQPTEAYSKSTPHLTAILSRAATRTRKAFPFKFAEPAPVSSNVEYRPSSISSFLSRLSTFKLATYANKPPAVDAVAAAKCGWVNDGKDRLLCGICHASWVVAGRDGMSRDAANALIEKQKGSLVSAHKDGCPWKTRQCDASIYRMPLQSPTAAIRDIKANAVALDSVLQDTETKHPMTANQLTSLQSTAKLYSLSTDAEPSETDPSETALLASLFGWTIAPPLPSSTRTPSVSRASSVAPSVPSSPARASSRAQTPSRLSVSPKHETLLHCPLCQRRVGLWAFAPRSDLSVSSRTPARRQFDLLKEHRSYCPYVVRSTTIPSLGHIVRPSSSAASLTGSGEIEGWRAVLTVLLRYRMAQRSQLSGLHVVEGDEGGQNDAPEVDGGVNAMMEGVKARGGKDLLKYVKGLLG